MRIIGIDPGLAIVGYGVLEYKAGRFTTLAYGSITTPAHTEIPDRLQSIYHQLDDLIKMYRPEDIAVEELFFHNNQKTVISVAEARGVILLCAKMNGLNIYEYTPLQVKQAVVGYGRAEKKQVISMVTSLLNLKEPPKPDDTADALAIAVCRAHSGGSQIEQYLKRMSR
ncbi:MAG: crossover junction endodeoxyribonuclease RuvC [Ruminococcaceae bacterium]|nr:crossover junction endodeoxyribonuclease RuvC [Oscillospiraceae bacterium]